MPVGKNRRNIVIGQKIWDKLRETAEQEERSMSEIIREALHDFFMKREKEKTVSGYDPIKDQFM